MGTWAPRISRFVGQRSGDEGELAIGTRIPWSSAYAGLAGAQKPRSGVSLYSHHINRPLGRILAASAGSVGLSPNALTVISGLMIVAAAAMLATVPPTALTGCNISLLLVLSFALDSADGQLARMQGSGSPFGEWLDHVMDAAKGVLIHGGVLVAGYRYLDVSTAWLLVPLAFQLVAVTTFSAGVLRELLGRISQAQSTRRGTSSRLRAALLLPADSGILALVFVILAWDQGFQALYTVLLLLNAIIGASLMAKWYRELRRISNPV